jgi:hypothetical protein
MQVINHREGDGSAWPVGPISEDEMALWRDATRRLAWEAEHRGGKADRSNANVLVLTPPESSGAPTITLKLVDGNAAELTVGAHAEIITWDLDDPDASFYPDDSPFPWVQMVMDGGTARGLFPGTAPWPPLPKLSG